jgi:hypothetical protein
MVLPSVVLLVLAVGEPWTSTNVPPLREARVLTSGIEAVRSSDATSCTTSPESTRPLSNDGVVVIQGIFDAAGEKLLKLKPVHRYAYRSRTIPDQKEGRFAVKLTFISGTVMTVPFDALVADDVGRTAHGFFEVVIPVSGGIASICITDMSGQKTFACIDGTKVLQ